MLNRRQILAVPLLALASPVLAADRADVSREVLLTWQKLVLELVRHTATYMPPVAARAFAYIGIAAHEALATGNPALRSLAGQVTDLPVLREHLQDGRDCVMVPAGDSGPLSDALVSAVRDDELRARLRDGGKQTIQRFTWATCAEEHERLYGRISGQG